MIGNERTMLWSGGIGDFLHYLIKVDGYTKTLGLEPADLTIYFEATNPANIRSFLARALPEVNVHFVPPALHWIIATPLLDAHDPHERAQRPAARFVRQQVGSFQDWFGPLACRQYRTSTERLRWLLDDAPAGRTVVLSARDKGFLWFPSREVVARVATLLGDRPLLCLGTASEETDYLQPFRVCTSAEEALRLSCQAELLIGVDTGLATVRELLGKPNIYCADQYWLERFMVRFGFWSEELSRRSSSTFASDPGQLLDRVAEHLAGQRHRVAPEPARPAGEIPS
jgi:hypothetical protein